MEKLEKERSILSLAEPILKNLYGAFEIDDAQIDKPDAAIIIDIATNDNNSKAKNKIGIEITSVDKKIDQQYFNDEKFTKKITSAQIDNFMQDKSYSTQPLKKQTIEFTDEYIYDGIIKKQDKYSNYANSDKYKEIIILAFSSYLTIDDETFIIDHQPWTNYLLSKQEFPFDKVIFICTKTKNAVLLYDKKFPQLEEPQKTEKYRVSTTVAHSSFIPIGESFNINNLFDNEPLAPAPNKSRSKKKK